MMLDATAIKMPAEPGLGMYESFYFRGTGADGMQAFWLKHGMLRYRDWEHVALEVSNGSSVEIGHGHVAGRLVGEGGKARWDLQLRRSGMKLYPFPHAAMYSLPWPGNKLL